MIELEKLYECAGLHLEKTHQNWEKFATDFENIFSCKMVLFRSKQDNSGIYLQTREDIIAGANSWIVTNFLNVSAEQLSGILSDPVNPFEPSRRTNATDNETYKQSSVYHQFARQHGVFYLMLVFAALADGSNLVLVVWRDEHECDFSNIEKQRIALFMRHLATCVKRANPNNMAQVSGDVNAFGKKFLLTEAEMVILSALLAGTSMRAIAAQTQRTYGTVRWHAQNILEKCQVNNQQSLLSEFYKLIER